MQTRRLVFFLLTLFFSAASFAVIGDGQSYPPRAVLNKITYQATVERWATTDTAKVTVAMDAALDKVGLASANSHVIESLNKIAPNAGWHVTQFSRMQDKSGLEMLHVEAEARLAQNMLSDLRDKAKAISKPGETYTVGDVDFTPTLVEMEKTHADARAAIYDQVKQEIARLNQLYPDQHYFLHQLDFMQQVMPMNAKMEVMAMGAANGAHPAPAAPSIPVNSKITETAQAVIAARAPGKTETE